MAHPRDVRIAELQAEIEAAKAEIAELKAAAQTEKAEDKTGEALNFKAAAEQSTAIGLEGERGDDGSLLEVPIAKTEEESKAQFIAEAATWGLKPNTRENEAHNKRVLNQQAENWSMGTVSSNDEFYTTRQHLIDNPWFQEVFGDTYNNLGAPLEVTVEKSKGDLAGSSADLTSGETGEHGSGMDLTGQNKAEEVEIETTKTKPSDEVDMITEKQIADPDDDIEGDERTDAESEKMRHGGIDPEQGRTKPVESDARSEKPGWETEEGSNTWSINEKDDYWKTQEGFNEAMDLYGQKPSWLKEPTLVYNPETDEYEEIEEEEFEDLSRPAISADIKKLFG